MSYAELRQAIESAIPAELVLALFIAACAVLIYGAVFRKR